MIGLSRRAALLTVTGVMGILYGRMTPAQSGGRQLLLTLDDVEAIVVQYRGQRIPIPPQAIVDALVGKEEE